MGAWTVADLEHEYPAVPWREPASVTVLVAQEAADGPPASGAVSVLVCRVCVANDGLSGSDVLAGTVAFWDDPERFAGHLAEAHS